MLAQLVQKHGLSARVQPFTDVSSAKGFKIDALDARIVCLSYFGAGSSPVHVRYLIRRLRRVMPSTKFVACFWMLQADQSKLEEWRKIVGADLMASSLIDAARICLAEASSVAVSSKGVELPALVASIDDVSPDGRHVL